MTTSKRAAFYQKVIDVLETARHDAYAQALEDAGRAVHDLITGGGITALDGIMVHHTIRALPNPYKKSSDAAP